MAKFVFTSPKVTLNGTANDVSASCRSLTIDITAAEVDTTNFGSAGFIEMAGGLKGGSVSIEWNDDVAAAAIDSAIWPLLGGTAALTWRPAGTAAIGSANPEYQATVLVTQTTSGGAVGDLATKSVTWPTTGTITRATA